MYLNSIECIIFDMDGTLIDSSKAMCNSVNFVRSRIGLSPLTKEFLEYHINQPDENLPMVFYETPEFKKEHRELFKKHYLSEGKKYIKLYDGTKDILKSLVKRYSLYIATNAHTIFAKSMLEYLNIYDYFTDIVGLDSVTKTKPSAEMIELILKKGGFLKKEAILIGDSIKDMFAAKNANIDFIYAKWGYCSFEYDGIIADRMEDLREIFKLIK